MFVSETIDEKLGIKYFSPRACRNFMLGDRVLAKNKGNLYGGTVVGAQTIRKHNGVSVPPWRLISVKVDNDAIILDGDHTCMRFLNETPSETDMHNLYGTPAALDITEEDLEYRRKEKELKW